MSNGIDHLVLFCRPGFEGECAAEIGERAGVLGIPGYAKARPGSALVFFVCQQKDGAFELIKQLAFDELVFARAWFAGAPVAIDSPEDRISPLVASAEALPRCGGLLQETADTNDGKQLQALAKKLQRPLESVLRKRTRLKKNSPWRMHLLWLSGTEAFLGTSNRKNASAWAGGIPRLRVPKDAPSRATLKLEEAWHHFIPQEEWDTRLAPSMRAVDLGAAPGGWTYQLVQRSMFVYAVDNGPMAQSLMDTGQVEHVKADGFSWRPPKPVHWLVCDIVDKPSRTAAMVSDWFVRGDCREAVFNLKLPMKKRYAEVVSCAEKISTALRAANIEFELRMRQLYFDREEVTVHLRRVDLNDEIAMHRNF